MNTNELNKVNLNNLPTLMLLLATSPVANDAVQDPGNVGEAGGVGKTYMQTYVRLVEYSRNPTPNEDGTPGRKIETSVLPEQRANKKIEEAKKLNAEGKLDADLIPEVQVAQSAIFTEAKVIDELLPLCTKAGKEDQAEAIALGHFNRGAILSQQQEIRGLLEDPKFEPVEGTLDLAYAIAEKSESRAKSPEEKAAKALQGLPQFQGMATDEITQLLAQFAAARAAAQPTT